MTAGSSSSLSDSPLRLPVLLFFSSAVFWLIIGSALALLAAWKLVDPAILDFAGFLTYGRVLPAGENALIYGWASQAGIGAGLWLLGRLGRPALVPSSLLFAAALAWNIGVLLGVCGILAGSSTGFAGLEFPGYASAVLLFAYLCIAIWALLLLRNRTTQPLFASQWYLLAAFLWFPWTYITANALLVWCPASGPAQIPLQAWFSGNLVWLWLAPLSLGLAYFWVPELTKRPLRAYSVSILGFWCLALLGGWTGTKQFIGGPIPAWLASVGVASSIMLVIPAILICINIFGSLRSGEMSTNPVLSFIGFGLVCFAIAVGQGAATPVLSGLTQFTDYVTSQNSIILLGFVSMILFGAVYGTLTRILGKNLCPDCVPCHFWLVTWGFGFLAGGLILGGIVQGFALTDPGVKFASVLQFVWPFRVLAALGSLAFFLGVLAFAALFVKTLIPEGLFTPASKKRGVVNV